MPLIRQNMKQTNNALKFLLAQYRAIFKNAYVKGLAAVALTAGLAISAAQPANAAYSLVSADDTATSGTGWSSLKADTTYKVDGTGAKEGEFSKIELSGSLTNQNNFILDITSGGDANKIITAGAVTDVKAVNATINLYGDSTKAKLLISGSSSSGAALTVGTFSIGNSTSGGTLVLQGAQDDGAGSLTANTIKLNSGSIVFSGTTAGAAVLTGMLDTSEASTSLGTLDFTGASGTISAWGDNQSLNIKVDGSNKAASAVLNLTGSGDKSRLGIDSGTFTLGSKVKIGYYDQEHHVLHDEKTIFEEISDDYPNLNNTQIRNTLAAFQFTGDEVYKLIRELSGGEKGRVSLAKLMLSEANFLILDEPTNHLDITSKEILEQALNDYTGTILYVSHDRYFINQTASRILELVNQTFVNYIGNYDYYLEKKEELTAIYAAGNDSLSTQIPFSTDTTTSSSSESKRSWKEQKEQQARERKRKNELKKTEDRIAVLEERNMEIDQLMTQEDIYSNSVKCQELANEKNANDTELETLYEKWEELAE